MVAQPPVRSMPIPTFPGLWLAVPDLLSGQILDVLNVLQMGLGTPEHQAFVQALRDTL